MSRADDHTRRPRRAYSYRTASEDYSVSVRELRRFVDAGKVRAKHVGRMVFLHPDDLERIFGFGLPPREPSPAARAMARRLLGTGPVNVRPRRKTGRSTRPDNANTEGS